MSNTKIKKVLLTGITGQVASIYADFLLANTDVDIIGSLRWQEPIDNIRHLTDRINKKDRILTEFADLNDYSSFERLIKKHKPDVIVSLAAESYPTTSFSNPLITMQTNILGTNNILEIVRIMKEEEGYNPLIHIVSSSEVYGKASSNKDGKDLLIGEETKFHGASPYSISKIATDYLGQFYGEAYNMNTVVTRLGTHTGARRGSVFVESVMARKLVEIEMGLHKPEVLMGNLESIRTFQNARDAVRAYWLLTLEMEKGNIKKGDYFNIAGNEKFKLSDLLETMKQKINYKNKISVGIDPDRLRVIDADYQLFECDKIKKVIDWEPEISMDDTIDELLDYWRTEYKEGRVPLDR